MVRHWIYGVVTENKVFLALLCVASFSCCQVMICMCFTTAIAIKESVHVGDKTQKRLARGVDDLGIHYNIHTHTQVHVLYHRQVISVFVWKFDGVFLLNGHIWHVALWLFRVLQWVGLCWGQEMPHNLAPYSCLYSPRHSVPCLPLHTPYTVLPRAFCGCGWNG